ncbi:TPA: hypothetical protein EYP38_02890 [Candidatus Micrarchaeota archaeon]|nr:hypothetical protein [Candidatus Micrarchaeota archaeon]
MTATVNRALVNRLVNAGFERLRANQIVRDARLGRLCPNDVEPQTYANIQALIAIATERSLGRDDANRRAAAIVAGALELRGPAHRGTPAVRSSTPVRTSVAQQLDQGPSTGPGRPAPTQAQTRVFEVAIDGPSGSRTFYVRTNAPIDGRGVVSQGMGQTRQERLLSALGDRQYQITVVDENGTPVDGGNAAFRRAYRTAMRSMEEDPLSEYSVMIRRRSARGS